MEFVIKNVYFFSIPFFPNVQSWVVCILLGLIHLFNLQVYNRMERGKERRWIKEKGTPFFFPPSLFFSITPHFVSVCLACRRNMLLYLHSNDPSSGPQGGALCITQRSIRARAHPLLCPIWKPLPAHSFTVISLLFSHTCPASAPYCHRLCKPQTPDFFFIHFST